MKTIEAIIMIFFLFSYTSYSQKLAPAAYKDSITKILKQRTDITDFFFDEEYYPNKQLKSQKLYVKYKTDSIDRYFHVGQCFHFRKDGKLKELHEIDINALIEKGATISYNMKGEIWFKVENYSVSSSELNNIDSSTNINVKHGLSRYYWINDSALFFNSAKLKSKGVLVSRGLPRFYIEITYFDGCKTEYTENWYDPAKKKYTEVKNIKYLLNPKE